MMAGAKRWVGYALLALLVYLGFVLATLPASTLSWLLARVSPGTVALEQPQGTVWSGSGVLRLASPAIAPAVRWELLPSRLLRATLAVRIEAELDRAKLQTELRRDWRTWSAHGLSATLPAESLPTLIPAARLLAPQGDLTLTSAALRLGPGTLNGTAEVVWANAGAQMMSLEGIGQYRVTLEGRGAELGVRAGTDSGDLEITAEGAWQAFGDGTLALAGTANARGRQQQLEPLLQMIGPSGPDGTRTFNLRTQLPALPR